MLLEDLSEKMRGQSKKEMMALGAAIKEVCERTKDETPGKDYVGCLSLSVTSSDGAYESDAGGVRQPPDSTHPTPTQAPQCSTSAPAVSGRGDGINAINSIPNGPIVNFLHKYMGESNDDYEGPIRGREEYCAAKHCEK